MPDYEALKTKVDELAERDWDIPLLEAKIRKLTSEGIPPKTLNPEEMIANKEEILDCRKIAHRRSLECHQHHRQLSSQSIESGG